MGACCGSSASSCGTGGAPTVGPAVRKECGAAARAMAARELVKPQSCLPTAYLGDPWTGSRN